MFSLSESALPSFSAGGFPASPVPKDGGSLLHHQGQGQAGQTGPQEDLHLRGFHPG